MARTKQTNLTRTFSIEESGAIQALGHLAAANNKLTEGFLNFFHDAQNHRDQILDGMTTVAETNGLLVATLHNSLRQIEFVDLEEEESSGQVNTGNDEEVGKVQLPEERDPLLRRTAMGI